MKKKSDNYVYRKLTDKTIKDTIKETNNIQTYQRHIDETAQQLNISPAVVSNVIDNLAYQVLHLIQSKVSSFGSIKINLLYFVLKMNLYDNSIKFISYVSTTNDGSNRKQWWINQKSKRGTS